MKLIFNPGDQKEFKRVVLPEDVAAFDGKVVHSVCSTFALARDMEWTTRQFVLEMIDDDEEGIGTMLTIEHKSPAFIGEEVIFTATMEALTGNELICTIEVKAGNRSIATGKTGQKILKKEKIKSLFNR